MILDIFIVVVSSFMFYFTFIYPRKKKKLFEITNLKCPVQKILLVEQAEKLMNKERPCVIIMGE